MHKEKMEIIILFQLLLALGDTSVLLSVAVVVRAEGGT